MDTSGSHKLLDQYQYVAGLRVSPVAITVMVIASMAKMSPQHVYTTSIAVHNGIALQCLWTSTHYTTILPVRWDNDETLMDLLASKLNVSQLRFNCIHYNVYS